MARRKTREEKFKAQQKKEKVKPALGMQAEAPQVERAYVSPLTDPRRLVYAYERFVKGIQKAPIPKHEPVVFEREALRRQFDRTSKITPSADLLSKFVIDLLARKMVEGKISIKPNSRILSVGSGTGLHEVFLAKLCPEGKVVGVDFSIGMNRTAKGLATIEKVENTLFVLGDGENLPIRRESCNVALCLDMLNYSENWQDVVLGISKSLIKEKESRALITVVNSPRGIERMTNLKQQIQDFGLEIVDSGTFEAAVTPKDLRPGQYERALQSELAKEGGKLRAPTTLYLIARPKLG